MIPHCVFRAALIGSSLAFREDPKTLGQLALWLQNMPLKEVEENGFFIMLIAGATLYLPPGIIQTEASIGSDGAAVLSYPTLIRSQWPTWETTWKAVAPLLNPNNASQVSVCESMDLVSRMLMLGAVKFEDDCENDPRPQPATRQIW